MASCGGRVGQVEHDGGVGGLEADGAGGGVDEGGVAVRHQAVSSKGETERTVSSCQKLHLLLLTCIIQMIIYLEFIVHLRNTFKSYLF